MLHDQSPKANEQGLASPFCRAHGLPVEASLDPSTSLLFSRHSKVNATVAILENGVEVLYIDRERIALDPARHYAPSTVLRILNTCETEDQVQSHLNVFLGINLQCCTCLLEDFDVSA